MIKHCIFLWACLLSASCTGLLFQPSKDHVTLPENITIAKLPFFFDSLDNTRLHGWHLPSAIDADNPKQTILFLHGNALNISSHISAIHWLPELGYEVYIIDYRGYGKSLGHANLDGIQLDIEAALAYVTNQLKKDQQFIVMAHSLGASMAITAISQSQYKKNISIFIAASAFSDYRAVVADHLNRHWLTWPLQWPLSLTINNQYRPLDYVASISPIPIILLHGINDYIVLNYHSLELYQAAKQPKSITILRGNHNNIFAWKQNRKTIIDYIENHVSSLP